jgi:hypothetical protein
VPGEENDVMSDDGLLDRRRLSEEEYFRQRDHQLVERLRRQAERAAARDRLSQRVGVAGDALLQQLETLGFSDETAPLLHIVPLLHVAWLDGAMSASASRRIVEAAREQGIDAESAAGRQLRLWLEVKPPGALFPGALQAIGMVLQQQGSSEREHYARNLLEECTAIAAASGGVLGFGKISRRERDVLDRLRRELEAAVP